MTLRLPDEVHEALRREAFESRRSMNAIILSAIEASKMYADAWNEGHRLLEPEGEEYPPAAFWYRGRMYRYVLEG
jgi:hypothetical protein